FLTVSSTVDRELPPGKYTMEVAARTGEQTVVGSRSFTVEEQQRTGDGGENLLPGPWYHSWYCWYWPTCTGPTEKTFTAAGNAARSLTARKA
ncbi:MAG: hypothetical protein ABEJ66_00695, partial [Candidatus Nanohaloarchaea archaeon]